MEKQHLRKQVIQQLHQLTPSDHERKSAIIVEKVLASDEFKYAKTIGITLSRFPEVDTHRLIEIAWQSGKRVAIPRCISSTREMDFRLIDSFDQTEVVYMDLKEPKIEVTESINPQEIDLQIVPGVVYSETGYRIGFGGGYYDRYLINFPFETISLAFDCQIRHNIAREPHDIPVSYIYTDEHIIDCQKAREANE
ncbi:5-formyltetrahydrofolate cyclo-ligase [Sporosarcina sp. P21c]|uniref:5-formyltetrahydrofolate cyclo-ligase n=1 Tax=Sporosarcina TaxID=1569 RepID=UPI000A1624B9|nr:MULTISPECIES: 5-formyltetrahydrofolate cyclo-ligase [Sporosarcina]ARJ37418.1 5-formyltetrahydrofolate cyclo-ligase [Sporosarcina ureae]PIC66957.1 5-formyltetrahydrofolate cyclo-ligase [Sporosarcina sp. P16a]PIC84772.1 5-formyltetrahydrofolate cyclo-ligase [Sporosarcina sp. P1]PIC89457.1 5-formyltetrahydrofolate cyclo-ligase [Sporosarcina sp. P21c]PIC92409.1 5-formyltetrahydrofolate cyclo-ligase [Sporosarcina sp. P25]